MKFILLHDQAGSEVLVNLGNVESVLELPDGSCAICFVGRNTRKRVVAFYPLELYADVVKKMDYAVPFDCRFCTR